MNWRPGDHTQGTTAGPSKKHGPHPSKPLISLSRSDVLLLALALENFMHSHPCRHIPLLTRHADRIHAELSALLVTK